LYILILFVILRIESFIQFIFGIIIMKINFLFENKIMFDILSYYSIFPIEIINIHSGFILESILKS